MSTVSDYFARHEEQAFILKAFATIAAILLLREFLSRFIFIIILLFPVFFLLWVRLEALMNDRRTFDILREHITFMPVMYTEGERKKDKVAAVTYSLILANVLVYYLFQLNPLVDEELIGNNLVFLPRAPNLVNVPLSAFTSFFLHGNWQHLWGNMIFLWAVGTVVERRIGHKRFLLIYLITGLVAGFSFVLVTYLASGEPGHILGASGAIAGIMGIFAVRCYFKSMVFPLPILGIFSLILPISLKIRLNSLVIIGLFFFMDLSSGIGQIAGDYTSNVGYWAHIGGMLSGVGLAFFLKLGEGAIEERHLDIGAKAANARVGWGGGEKSLRIALEKNPDNPEALIHLARIKTKFTIVEEADELYRKAIRLLSVSAPEQAAEIYDEYFRKYHKGMEPALQFRLASIFYRNMNLDMAGRCLEMLLRAEELAPELKERGLFQYASIMEEMGLMEVSRDYFKQFLALFPDSAASQKVKIKLGMA
jgi:membrane associated rhomboid family serine protease